MAKQTQGRLGDMRIEYVALSAIQGWPQNPKLHADAVLDASLDRFGYVAPLLRDEGTGRLVAGHGRLDRLVARKAEGKPPPERIKVRRGEWLVPVICGFSFESAEEAEAYLLADNQTTILGGWKDADLAPMLERVRATAGQFAGVGFTAEHLADAKARLAAAPADQAGEENGRSEPGDQPLLVDVHDLRAPFPWFGGKSRAAGIVWGALSADVPNYVEPFLGSGAVLLARPGGPGKIETVNDLDRWVANFWRAVAQDPETVAAHADWPVNEADLHARHKWLLGREEWKAKMQDVNNPDFFDARIAGWWVWGLCAWIGSGWCSPNRLQPAEQPPFLGNGGMGLHRVTMASPTEQLPHLGNTGRGIHAITANILAWMQQLRDRMRRVRVACGPFERVLSDAVTIGHGLTGIFLDPPYAEGADDLYGNHDKTVSARVRSWAIEHGGDPLLRIVFCGYAGEHEAFPKGWRCIHWKAQGGYGSGNGNPYRERIWLSPHCLAPSSVTA